MLQIILESPQKLKLKESSDPDIGQGELLVDIHTAFTCGTTLKTYVRGHPKIPFNSPFGHEFSGTVTSVSAEETTFRPGDRVVALHSYPCERCYYCMHERPNLCEHFSSHLNLGAFADKILLPSPIVKRYCFNIPDHISFERAAFLQSTSCVMHALKKMHLHQAHQQTVAVIGSGSFGMLMGMVLKSLGHRPVFKLRNSHKIEILKEFGFDAAIEIEEVRSYFPHGKIMYVVEAAGQKTSWTQALSLVSAGGKVLWFGGMAGSEEFMLDHHKMHYSEIEAFGVFHYVPEDVDEAKNLLFGTLDPTPLLSGYLPLTQLEEAFINMQNGKGHKYAIHP